MEKKLKNQIQVDLIKANMKLYDLKLHSGIDRESREMLEIIINKVYRALFTESMDDRYLRGIREHKRRLAREAKINRD